MDKKSMVIFIFLIATLLTLVFGDRIFRSKWYRQVSNWLYRMLQKYDMSTQAFRDWLFVFIGSAITYGVKAVVSQDWVSLAILVGILIMALYGITRIDRRSEKKEEKYHAKIDAIYDNMLDKETAKALTQAIKELSDKMEMVNALNQPIKELTDELKKRKGAL